MLDEIVGFLHGRFGEVDALVPLPVPEVLDIGEAFDRAFAVSTRLRGDKLDQLPPQRLSVAIDALLAVPDRNDRRISGWRRRLREAPEERKCSTKRRPP